MNDSPISRHLSPIIRHLSPTIHVYICDRLNEFDLGAALLLLPEQRREQALSFKFEAGRRQSVAAYLLLCEGLSREYGFTKPPVFEYGEHGKPFIKTPPGYESSLSFFNLSHCREAAICVLSDRPVGVDIESIREFRESLARYTMNESELHQILQSDTPAEAFIRLWTMKEATLKRSGEGIRNNMKDVLSGQHALETFVNKTRGYVYTVAY